MQHLLSASPRFCAVVDKEGGLQVDDVAVLVDYANDFVKCKDGALLARVEKAVERMRQAMGPCSHEDPASPESLRHLSQ